MTGAALEEKSPAAAPASATELPIVANAPAGAGASAIDFLSHVADFLPACEGAAFRKALEQFEAGETFDGALGLPADWRVRERDRLLRELRSFGLSPAGIETELRRGARSSFPSLALRIVRLDGGRMLCARQIRRIVG